VIHRTDTVIHRTDGRDLSDRVTLYKTFVPQTIPWFFFTLQEFQEYPKDTKCVAYHAHGVRACHVPTVALRTSDPVCLWQLLNFDVQTNRLFFWLVAFPQFYELLPQVKNQVYEASGVRQALRNTRISRWNWGRRQYFVRLLTQVALPR
jgi:hypothetical protein